jgi:hypothetical protein
MGAHKIIKIESLVNHLERLMDIHGAVQNVEVQELFGKVHFSLTRNLPFNKFLILCISGLNKFLVLSIYAIFSTRVVIDKNETPITFLFFPVSHICVKTMGAVRIV